MIILFLFGSDFYVPTDCYHPLHLVFFSLTNFLFCNLSSAARLAGPQGSPAAFPLLLTGLSLERSATAEALLKPLPSLTLNDYLPERSCLCGYL